MLKKGMIVKESGRHYIVVGIVKDSVLLLDFNNNTEISEKDCLEIVVDSSDYNNFASSLMYVVLGFEDDRFDHLIDLCKGKKKTIKEMDTISETKLIENYFKKIIKSEYSDGHYNFDFFGDLAEMRGIELHSDTVHVYKK